METAQWLKTVDTDVDIIRLRAHAQLVSLIETMTTLRTRSRRNFIEFLERQSSDIGALLRNLDKPIPGFSAMASFRNHLDGARKALEEDRASLQRRGIRLRSAIQRLRSEIAILPDSEIGSSPGPLPVT